MRKNLFVLFFIIGLVLFLSKLPTLTYAATLFQEDFTDADNTELSQHNSTWSNTSGLASYILNNQLAFPFGSSFYSLNGFSNQADQCVSTDFFINSWWGADFALSVRYSTNSRYEFGIGDWYWKIAKWSGSSSTVLVSGSRSPDFGTINSLKFCAVGSVLDAYLNGTLVASVNDSSISQGTAGIFADQPVIIDNFVFTDGSEVSPLPTPVPPATPTPTPTPPVLFQDTFTDYNTADLHNHNPTWINQYGHAFIFDNKLNFDYYTANGVHYVSSFYTLDGFSNQANQCVATNYNFNGYWGNVLALDIRYSTNSRYDFYYNGGEAWGVEKWIGSNATTLASGNIDPSTINSLKFCAVGSVLDAFINGTLVASVNDSSISQGTAGLYDDQPVLLDNFVYTDGSEVSPYPTPPNTAPTINSIPNATKSEGDTYSYTGSFTDSDSTSWTGKVDYGDGTGEHGFASPSESIDPVNHTFTISHVYKDNRTTPYHVVVTITDNQGAPGQASTDITVNNVAPTVSPITASVNPVQVNVSTSASATFTDTGVLDSPFTVVWQWGDGNSDTYQVSPIDPTTPVALSYPHTYQTAGVYPITLTVTDKDGGVGTQTYQYLSVYNPTPQGIFSAASKYTSPAGAYLANSSLTGPAIFGLSYKYQGSVPTGNREFTLDFNAANFHFNATNVVSSLVIANGIGTLTGTGTVSGQAGTYNFLVTGSEANNTIRVKITDQAGTTTIYDTQPNADDTAAPTTSVTGQVIAH